MLSIASGHLVSKIPRHSLTFTYSQALVSFFKARNWRLSDPLSFYIFTAREKTGAFLQGRHLSWRHSPRSKTWNKEENWRRDTCLSKETWSSITYVSLSVSFSISKLSFLRDVGFFQGRFDTATRFLATVPVNSTINHRSQQLEDRVRGIRPSATSKRNSSARSTPLPDACGCARRQFHHCVTHRCWCDS